MTRVSLVSMSLYEMNALEHFILQLFRDVLKRWNKIAGSSRHPYMVVVIKKETRSQNSMIVRYRIHWSREGSWNGGDTYESDLERRVAIVTPFEGMSFNSIVELIGTRIAQLLCTHKCPPTNVQSHLEDTFKESGFAIELDFSEI